MKLEELEVYKLSREISKDAWMFYTKLDWQAKKTIGDQFISSIDSIAANIAEGFGRFHYLDKNKFNYNSRGSLFESIHWTNLLIERKLIKADEGEKLTGKLNKLAIKLNNYINATRKQKDL